MGIDERKQALFKQLSDAVVNMDEDRAKEAAQTVLHEGIMPMRPL
jgi:methanogenic corrinoid protein MtbC1